MQLDFHYYATYCAAYLAGFPANECVRIAYSAQFVDCCSKTLLKKVGANANAATTQLQLEMMDSDADFLNLLDITRIWTAFHFLPGDLSADPGRGSRRYRNKYRLICNTNGSLLKETVELARGKGVEATGLAMHVLADTWAHRYFAGIPSLVINNTNYYFYEIMPGVEETLRQVKFNHNPVSVDDPEKGLYTNSMYQGNENSIMNLGHGRAGHFPDYSFARYKYMPAWGDYREILKDNPADYMQAFCQMVYAMKSLRDPEGAFETDHYDYDTVSPYKDRIEEILIKRQIDACADWKAFGEELSENQIPDFDIEEYQRDYVGTDKNARKDTALGRFINAALAQKGMVSQRITESTIKRRKKA